MEFPFVAFSALFGLIWGSFCNVLISRVPLSESIGGRSHCPSCKHTLSSWELVPLLSYLFLRGRCSHCHEPISVRYPVVEGVTALLFVLTYLRMGLSPFSLALYYVYVILALSILFVDFEHAIIPNVFSITGMLIALLASVFRINPAPAIIESLLGGALGGGLFLGLYLITRGMGLGMGDVKLALFMGLALGPLHLLLAVLIGAVSGLLFAGIIMLMFGKQLRALPNVSMHMNQEEEEEITQRICGMMIINGRPAVPFGSFLSLGFLVALFWGDAFLQYWLGLL